MQAIFARIVKVDEARQEVTGCAVQEIVDRDNEIFDYQTSKPEFMKWSAEVSADTGGRSLGNVRSMHGNIAAGKLTDMQFDDAEKSIQVTAKIIDPIEWKKVTEGVYSGFSIGGRYAKRWAEAIGGKMIQRYTAVPSEISIVDRPCVYTAKFHHISKNGFTFVKRDGSAENRNFSFLHDVKMGEDGLFEVVQKGGPGSGPHGGSSEGKMSEANSASHAAYTASAKAKESGSKEDHKAASVEHLNASAAQNLEAQKGGKTADTRLQLAASHDKMARLHSLASQGK